MSGIGAAVLTGGGMPEAKRSSTTGLFSKLSLAAGGGSQAARGTQAVRWVVEVGFEWLPYLDR